MKRLSLLIPLIALIGCGGSGAGNNSPLVGTWTGIEFTTDPTAGTPATIIIAPDGAISGALTGSVAQDGTVRGPENGHAYIAGSTLVVLVSDSVGTVTTFELMKR